MLAIRSLITREQLDLPSDYKQYVDEKSLTELGLEYAIKHAYKKELYVFHEYRGNGVIKHESDAPQNGYYLVGKEITWYLDEPEDSKGE